MRRVPLYPTLTLPARGGGKGGGKRRKGGTRVSGRVSSARPHRPQYDAALGGSCRGGPARTPGGVAQRLARPGERLQLVDDGAAAALSRGVGWLSVLLWHPVEPAGPAGSAPGHVCRAEEFRDQSQRSDLLGGDPQHLSIHRRGDRAEDGRRARTGIGDEPAISAET